MAAISEKFECQQDELHKQMVGDPAWQEGWQDWPGVSSPWVTLKFKSFVRNTGKRGADSDDSRSRSMSLVFLLLWPDKFDERRAAVLSALPRDLVQAVHITFQRNSVRFDPVSCWAIRDAGVVFRGEFIPHLYDYCPWGAYVFLVLDHDPGDVPQGGRWLWLATASGERSELFQEEMKSWFTPSKPLNASWERIYIHFVASLASRHRAELASVRSCLPGCLTVLSWAMRLFLERYPPVKAFHLQNIGGDRACQCYTAAARRQNCHVYHTQSNSPYLQEPYPHPDDGNDATYDMFMVRRELLTFIQPSPSRDT